MLTPQEVSSHAFPKAVMGGYNMGSVDEFLDELTEDYTTLYKENAALKAKLKVMVEKVEDYRATEDSMRATLLTAQKMADNIVREAEAKRDIVLARAELDVQDRVAELKAEVTATEQRLKLGQQELAAFIAAVRDVCQKELESLERLPEIPVEAVKPVEETVAAVAAVTAEPAEKDPVDEVLAEYGHGAAAAEEPEEDEVDVTEEEEDEDADVKEYPEGNPFTADSDLKVTRRLDRLELKFGRNYGKD